MILEDLGFLLLRLGKIEAGLRGAGALTDVVVAAASSASLESTTPAWGGRHVAATSSTGMDADIDKSSDEGADGAEATGARWSWISWWARALDVDRVVLTMLDK
jgi:hypothetical protein